MPTRPLSERITSMPLILAGPILRKVSQGTVTVWVALRKQRTVKLTVYSNGTEFMSGTHDTVTLGPHLHVVAVTAHKTAGELTPGATYEYNVAFTGASDGCATGDLFTPGVMAASEAQARTYLSYKMAGVRPNAPARPSFVYAPEDLNLLRICHGSCRKPHGESVDGLVALDVMIRQALMPGADDPRPHMAFLSGDQIYADDVADPLLKLLMETGDFLLGGTEVMPGGKKPGDDYRPGYRAWMCENIKFTAHKTNKPEIAKSHLLMLGEFYSIYLFAWSDVLWPVAEPSPSTYKDFANWDEICQHSQLDMELNQVPSKQWWLWPNKWYPTYLDEIAALRALRTTLPQIRRALANVPVYMVFDDHEVTDDWYLNREWCAGVLDAGNLNGRRVVQNGLTAIAVFQAWGNMPEQFAPNTIGAATLSAVTNYHGGAGQLAQAAELQLRMGMATYADGHVVSGQTPALTERLLFHYQIKRDKYEIIALDTRTMRGFPGSGPQDPPEMLSPEALALQIPNTPMPANGVTMVIAPTNLISEWLTEFGGELLKKLQSVYDPDAGDAWTGQTQGFERFLARLANRAPDTNTTTRTARIVVLSGDIHYGFAQRLQYWAKRPFEAPEGTKPVVAVFAELVASSFKNEAFKTRELQEAKIKTLHSVQWLGWQQQPTEQQVRLRFQPQWVEWSPELARYKQSPSVLRPFVINVESQVNLQPDWRYRIDMIGDPSPALADSSGQVASYTSGPASFWLNEYKKMGFKMYSALKFLKLGRYIVGCNNMGEIRFQWGADESIDKWVHQRSWWMRPGDVEPHPWTTFPVSLRMVDSRYKQPRYLGESETE